MNAKHLDRICKSLQTRELLTFFLRVLRTGVCIECMLSQAAAYTGSQEKCYTAFEPYAPSRCQLSMQTLARAVSPRHHEALPCPYGCMLLFSGFCCPRAASANSHQSMAACQVPTNCRSVDTQCITHYAVLFSALDIMFVFTGFDCITCSTRL